MKRFRVVVEVGGQIFTEVVEGRLRINAIKVVRERQPNVKIIEVEEFLY